MDIDELSAAASKDIVRKPSTEAAQAQRPRNLSPVLSDDSIDDLIKSSSSDSESGKQANCLYFILYLKCF